MQTLLTRSAEEAAEFIKKGGVVAFPTETVYGLGANVFNEAAVAKIFEAKQRPSDNPLIAHVVEIEQIALLTTGSSDNALKFIEAFFPGPLTLVMPRSKRVPLIATTGLETIGVRMPQFELAHRFLAACNVPIVAPSANLSGSPSPTTWQAVYEDLNGRIDCILQGEATLIGLESTVVDCTSEVPLILRSGAVSLEQLQSVVPETVVYETNENEIPRSPGVKHKHYSPKAVVMLVASKDEVPDSESAAYIGINRPVSAFRFTKMCHSIEEYAHSLFEFFRECDRSGIGLIFCETVEEKGIGVALMDRLRRAAAK